MGGGGRTRQPALGWAPRTPGLAPRPCRLPGPFAMGGPSWASGDGDGGSQGPPRTHSWVWDGLWGVGGGRWSTENGGLGGRFVQLRSRY